MLDRKLLRDLWRLKAQVLAIALVMAAGASTLILGVGAYRSLDETRAVYYERERFADIFASVRRAPDSLMERIEAIPGVAAAEARIKETAILDIVGMAEPATAQLVSVPDYSEPVLNRLHLRAGRMPDPAHAEEVVINAAFADAHGFEPGSRFSAIINGRKRTLTVTGVALSPEYIYALGPWDLIPDDRRFAVVWMSRRALAAAFDLDGAFSALAVKRLHGASEAEIIDRIDALLERYGGRGAYGRDEQQSHAFVDAEIQQIQAMSQVLPPIFLFVAAFLVNITLSRLVALEREQIGLMKAVGYSASSIAGHYFKFVSVIALIGVAIGMVAGTLLGRGMTELLAQFFHFPYLIFDTSLDTYAIATLVTVAAAAAGAAVAVRDVVRLTPAVAMQPPAPPRYRRILPGAARLLASMPHTAVMISRNIVRGPVRALFTVLGVAFSVAILVASLFTLDAIDHMLDVTYFQTNRQDASIDFVTERSMRAIHEVAYLPGVMTVEPVRGVPVRLSNGHLERRTSILGKPADGGLSRVLDVDERPMILPGTGIVPTQALATALDIGLGDTLTVELLEGDRRTLQLPVTGMALGYFGLVAFMEIAEVNRMMREGPTITGAHVRVDDAQLVQLYAAIKALPAVGSISLQRVALENFRKTVAELIAMSMSVYFALAIVIAFGVIYNSARIQLSERARELASLRVLGFTRGETSWILLGELTVLTLAALPVGWLLGYGLALAMVEGFATDLFRLPFIIDRSTYAIASLVVLAATTISALVVRRRVDRLDLIEVLKTRE